MERLTGCPQAAARARGSISTQSVSLARHRTESTSMINRVRSDSNRDPSLQQSLGEDAEFLNHPVEPRARTAQLPPVMVCLPYPNSRETRASTINDLDTDFYV